MMIYRRRQRIELITSKPLWQNTDCGCHTHAATMVVCQMPSFYLCMCEFVFQKWCWGAPIAIIIIEALQTLIRELQNPRFQKLARQSWTSICNWGQVTNNKLFFIAVSLPVWLKYIITHDGRKLLLHQAPHTRLNHLLHNCKISKLFNKMSLNNSPQMKRKCSRSICIIIQ